MAGGLLVQVTVDGPRVLRPGTRAVHLGEGHVDAPVTVADLIEVAGVPGRTLFKHFRDSKGVSPIRYLRNARFRKAREDMMRAADGASVTAIALKWGSSHGMACSGADDLSSRPHETVPPRR